MEFNKLLDSGSKVAALVAAALSAVLTFKYSDMKERMEINKKELEYKVTQTSLRQDSIDFDRKHRFALYEKVYAAVESKDSNKIHLAAILIIEMLPGDQYQRSLLELVKKPREGTQQQASLGTQDLVKSAIDKLDSFAKDEELKQSNIQKVQSTAHPVKRDYLIDVFYLESKGPLVKNKADDIVQKLKQAGFNSRARKLSDIINSRAGYRIYTNQIRIEINNADEKQKAEELKKSLGSNFIITEVGQASPGYISVFVTE